MSGWVRGARSWLARIRANPYPNPWLATIAPANEIDGTAAVAKEGEGVGPEAQFVEVGAGAEDHVLTNEVSAAAEEEEDEARVAAAEDSSLCRQCSRAVAATESLAAVCALAGSSAAAPEAVAAAAAALAWSSCCAV